MTALITNEYPEGYFSHDLDVLIAEKWSEEGMDAARDMFIARRRISYQ